MYGEGVDSLRQGSVQEELYGVGVPKPHKVFTLTVRYKTNRNQVKAKYICIQNLWRVPELVVGIWHH